MHARERRLSTFVLTTVPLTRQRLPGESDALLCAVAFGMMCETEDVR
jgi:hypothetical protein